MVRSLPFHGVARMVGAAVVVAALAFPPSASATTLAALSVEQMVDASDIVATGTVRSVHSEWVAERRIVTYAEIEVDGASKGLAEAGDFVTVESPGGALDDGSVQDVESAARYSVGERVLVFLCEKRHGTSFGTVGMGMGKYTIKQDPLSGHDMIVRFTLPYSQTFDARFIPNPKQGQRVMLEDMTERVEARADLGWDGQPIPGVANDHLRAINKLQAGVK